MEKVTRFLISRWINTSLKKNTLFLFVFFLYQSSFSQNSIFDLLNGQWRFEKNMGSMDVNFRNTDSNIKIKDSTYTGEAIFNNPDQLLFKLASNQSCSVVIKIIKVKVKEDNIVIKLRIYLYDRKYKFVAIKIK
jgi:hypothetical protein